MRIALCSDEPYAVNEAIAEELEKRGHVVCRFGSVASAQEGSWVLAAQEAALAVAQGRCDEGVFFCWTGTGVSIAANKVPGVRAALCTDPETAKAARIWNHANVLALSNRLMSSERAVEILDAWLEQEPLDPRGDEAMSEILALEQAHFNKLTTPDL
jgi:ribose 5-phosphate isomerase B